MKSFVSYFTEESIILHLCKLRAKIANSRNKKHLLHLLTSSEKYNYHNEEKKIFTKDNNDINEFLKYQRLYIAQLNEILPPRRQWVRIGKDSRMKNVASKQNLSSKDQNIYSLIKTIKVHKKKFPNSSWVKKLNEFIVDIQNSVIDDNYKIDSPIIYPKLKDKLKRDGENICRPISLFSLKDRIILSITNKYLTNLFDRYFQDCSYAFRSMKNKNNTCIINHHDCIVDIIDYRMAHINEPLYVAECDIEKFYDSVNHKIIKKLFSDLLNKAANEFPQLNFENTTHIFSEYLNCYAFNKNVPLKTDVKYWDDYRIPNGKFEWIDKRLEELKYYNNIEDERIGVPQGGALSGLIANIVLDYADKEVQKTNVFYIRFCDDMVIIHPSLQECDEAKRRYINALKYLKLIQHEFNMEINNIVNNTKKSIPNSTFKPFWKCKSKGPYVWDKIENFGLPWIGFVGYEINYKGDVRVRKKSLHKELNKQEKVITEIKKVIKNGTRKSNGTITESAIHRLIGMSVGRITIRNYNIASNDLCWKNGFRELGMNKYSIQQMKILDRNRNKLYYGLVKELGDDDVILDKDKKQKARQIIHFNKPFSYYYQVLEREK